MVEAAIENLGEWLKRKTGSEGDNEFTNAFVSTSLTVCIGAMAIVGSIQDGLLGDWSTLALKGALDCIIVCTMTASLGRGCIFSALPVAVFQGTITLFAGALSPIMTTAALNSLSLVGSMLICEMAAYYRSIGSSIKEELERYSIIRTVTAVERADVVLMVIDAKEGVTEQDAKIAGIAHERGKGIIIVVNKWDAIDKTDKTIYEYTNKIKTVLSFIPYAEFVFVSALTGQRMNKLFEMIDMVRENQTLRIATGVLNEILAEAVALQQPPSDKGKRLKLYYMTQVAVKPPTFVVFVNDKELMHFSYTRYLENKIRDAFGFKGTSLKFLIRERKGKDQ